MMSGNGKRRGPVVATRHPNEVSVSVVLFYLPGIIEVLVMIIYHRDFCPTTGSGQFFAPLSTAHVLLSPLALVSTFLDFSFRFRFFEFHHGRCVVGRGRYVTFFGGVLARLCVLHHSNSPSIVLIADWDCC